LSALKAIFIINAVIFLIISGYPAKLVAQIIKLK
jgi:hypothetical protein